MVSKWNQTQTISFSSNDLEVKPGRCWTRTTSCPWSRPRPKAPSSGRSWRRPWRWTWTDTSTTAWRKVGTGGHVCEIAYGACIGGRGWRGSWSFQKGGLWILGVGVGFRGSPAWLVLSELLLETSQTVFFFCLRVIWFDTESGSDISAFHHKIKTSNRSAPECTFSFILCLI